MGYEPFLNMLIEFNEAELNIMISAMSHRVKTLLLSKERSKDKIETYPTDKLDERINKAVNLYNKLNFEGMKNIINKRVIEEGED